MFDDIMEDVNEHIENIITAKKDKLNEHISGILSVRSKETSVKDASDPEKVQLAGIEMRFLEGIWAYRRNQRAHNIDKLAHIS